MDILPLRVIEPRRITDARGWFSETYNRAAFADLEIECEFVQDNQSLSVAPYTVRGLHFQVPPYEQTKLIRVVRGRIFDVAVDIRRGSPTFGRWVGKELSADLGNQLFIPTGFAHGFMTLEPNCEIAYKCSAFYAPEADRGVRWDDPAIGVDWGIPAGIDPILSTKDRALPLLAEVDAPFAYDGCPLGR